MPSSESSLRRSRKRLKSFATSGTKPLKHLRTAKHEEILRTSKFLFFWTFITQQLRSSTALKRVSPKAACSERETMNTGPATWPVRRLTSCQNFPPSIDGYGPSFLRSTLHRIHFSRVPPPSPTCKVYYGFGKMKSRNYCAMSFWRRSCRLTASIIHLCLC